MATATATAPKSGSVADLMSALDASIGENDSADTVKNFIDTGYAPLNEALSGRYDGGLPFGRMVEMFGESSSGKTALATQWMVEAQRMGGVAGFIDWERSFDINLAKDFGLNPDRPYWIYNKARTWEDGNALAGKACRVIRSQKLIAPDAPILFVFDSIASAVPQSMLFDNKGKEREIDSFTMNDTSALSRVTSTTLKVMAQYCEEYNATFLYLNQMRLKIGVVFGDPRCLRGDVSVPFVDGTSMAIKDIVDQKITKDVWSFNESAKQFEPRPLIGWHDNGPLPDDQQWIHVTTEAVDTKNGAVGMTVTADHKFLTRDGWTEAKDITTLMETLSKQRSVIAGDARSFILGLLAGDSSLKKMAANRTTATLFIQDSNDPDYAEWKVKHLTGVLGEFGQVPIKWGGKGSGVRFNAPFSAELADLIPLARNPLAIFKEQITPQMLAIWIMDDGYLAPDRLRYTVSVKRLKNDEYLNELADFLYAKLGLRSRVRAREGSLIFDAESSKKIAELIAQYVPPCMERKLPVELRGKYADFSLKAVESFSPRWVRVLKVRTGSKRGNLGRYDVTVEGNHNYLVGNAHNGVLVHNCTPGGKAMEFYATNRMAIGRTKIMQQVDGVKEFVGQNIGIQVTKSKLTKPFKETEIRMSYDDSGVARFDFAYSLADLLIAEKKLISPRNGYIEYEGKQWTKRAFADMIVAENLMPKLNALLVA